MDNGATDKSQLNDLQSLLCATLQSVLRKMTKEDVPLLSDTIMTALLQVSNSLFLFGSICVNSPVANHKFRCYRQSLQMFNSTNKSGSVQEDALMTVSTLAEVMGESFIKYIEAFKPFLLVGLKNITEHQVSMNP